MKRRFGILFLFACLVVVLIALNAATYVQKEKAPDSEIDPNRSSYNAGATGTQAFYTLLSETGRKAIRWQEPPEALLTTRNKPSTFVMIGALRREVSKNESESLLRWVAEGGRLVVIDRDPSAELLTTTGNWKITVTSDPAVQLLSIDPSDRKQMTSGTDAARPIQPTLLTSGVGAVQTSRFAGWINFQRYDEAAISFPKSGNPKLSVDPESSGRHEFAAEADRPPDNAVYEPSVDAPFVHVTGNQKNLVVDAPFGSGKIVYLSDPYVVSNGGINIVDNSQLAINLVSGGGIIAFDEYHQGYGSASNRFFQFFEGTPVVAIFLQVLLLTGMIFYSQSRRFARPLPDNAPDRLSKLEYVSAMAELQRRTKAFDLAIENVYTDFRRRAARALGVDNTTSTRDEIARRAADRTDLDADSIAALMFKCEEIIHGEPTRRQEVIELIARLRQIEQKLGLRRSSDRGLSR